MVQQTLTDVFEDCIRRLAAGQTVEECLRLYPAYSDRLRPLLETGSTVRQLRVPQSEMVEDKALVWQQIERQFPRRLSRRGRGRGAVLQLLVAMFLLLLMLAATWFVLTRPDLPRDEEPVNLPVVETSTPTMTLSATEEPTLTLTPSPSVSWTPTASPTPSVTLTWTATQTVTTTPSQTVTPSLTPAATVASACGTPLSEQDAVNRVLEIYPNTTVTSISQQTKFGGTLVWEVQTSHGIEVNIDVACGTILTIETDDDGDSNQNTNDNTGESSSNDNLGESDSTNTNSDDNSNDNDDDHDDDDNSGHGSDDDHDDDDNSGSGSDNSGSGSDD